MRFRSWYCIQTHYRQEDIVRDGLDRQGFRTFLPMQGTGKIDKATGLQLLRPVFGGYIFASWDASQSWWPIMTTRGIKAFLGISKEAPRRLPLGVIESLQDTTTDAAEGDDIIDPDTRVRVLAEGMWKDHIGICKVSERDRVSLLFQIFNKEILVDFHRGDLRKA